MANPSRQPVAEHGVHISIPAQQLPQQASQQSGRWAGLTVRRLPAHIDLFLRHDHQLRQRIDQKREQNCSELAQLARLEAQGEITENQYIESSNHLMDRHKHEMGEIWLGYVSEQFSRLPEMAKTILHNDHNIPQGLLTMELANAYI